MRVYKIAFTFWPHISTGESLCKALETVYPNIPSFQTRNARPHFLNLTGNFINVKLFTLLTLMISPFFERRKLRGVEITIIDPLVG